MGRRRKDVCCRPSPRRVSPGRQHSTFAALAFGLHGHLRSLIFAPLLFSLSLALSLPVYLSFSSARLHAGAVS